MYSESDLANAVEAGVLTRQAADAFRNHVASGRSTPAVDEESFRLLTGFNDIFVAIATTLILVAVGWIGSYVAHAIVGGPRGPVELGIVAATGGFSVAAVSWLLAEYFTRQRRMALPSILLLLGFAGGMLVGFSAVFGANAPWLAEQIHAVTPAQNQQLGGGLAAIVGVLTAAATWLHWRRFMVPITVAVGAATAVGIAIAVILALVPGAKDAINAMLLASGLIVFAVAMWWDMSDLERRTRRSDVAFWLHLAAAPLIAHPIFPHARRVRRRDPGADGGAGDRALHRLRAGGAGGRSPRVAGLVAGLCAVGDVFAVPVDRRGRAERGAHRAGDRIGAADALRLLAADAARGGRRARRAGRQPAADAPAGDGLNLPPLPLAGGEFIPPPASSAAARAARAPGRARARA